MLYSLPLRESAAWSHVQRYKTKVARSCRRICGLSSTPLFSGGLGVGSKDPPVFALVFR